MGQETEGPPADWYSDPSDQGLERWWSGATWTEHIRPHTVANALSADGPQMEARPRPALRFIRTAADAEVVAAEWMKWMGFSDARRTPTGPDGGLDVVAAQAVAQVKLHGRPIGRPDLQNLHGAALGKPALFFAAEGFTTEATAWAASAGMALFRFDRQGEPQPCNALAQSLINGSLLSANHGGPIAHPPSGRHAFPIRCSDVRAVDLINAQRTGRFSNKESVHWIAQTWMVLYQITVIYSHIVGRRRQVRQSSQSTLFTSIGGHTFVLHMPSGTPGSVIVDSSVRAIEPLISASEIIGETTRMWNHYIGLRQPAVKARYEQALDARGIPIGVARSIRLHTETELLLPIFVAQLSHPTGNRLAVIDGHLGVFHPQVSAELTQRLEFITEQLNSTGARRIEALSL
jgi:hypothetical protein